MDKILYIPENTKYSTQLIHVYDKLSDKEQEKLSEALFFKNSFEFKVLGLLPLLVDLFSSTTLLKEGYTSKLPSIYTQAQLYFTFTKKTDSPVGNNRSSKNKDSFFQITIINIKIKVKKKIKHLQSLILIQAKIKSRTTLSTIIWTLNYFIFKTCPPSLTTFHLCKVTSFLKSQTWVLPFPENFSPWCSTKLHQCNFFFIHLALSTWYFA